MRISREQLRLYAVTDRGWLGTQTLAEQVKEAIENGVTCVQLREKHMDKAAFLQEAKAILPICQAKGVPLIINDEVEIAAACGADGVHVGQGDMAISEARRLLGPEKIIGTSAHNVREAVTAQEQGADYIGVGAVFGSATKTDATPLAFGELQKICQAVTIPVVAIGGISRENAGKLAGSGIDGIAVVSAIFAQRDIGKAAAELRRLAEEVSR